MRGSLAQPLALVRLACGDGRVPIELREAELCPGCLQPRCRNAYVMIVSQRLCHESIQLLVLKATPPGYLHSSRRHAWLILIGKLGGDWHSRLAVVRPHGLTAAHQPQE